MAKFIRDTGQQAQIMREMEATLNHAGVNKASLDKLMSTKSIGEILSDIPAVTQYFKLANLGLNAIVDPKQLHEVRGATPTPDYYREYFDNGIPQYVPYVNVIPFNEVFQPEAYGKNMGFKPEQVQALTMIFQGSGAYGDPGATWSDYETSGGNYGGGGGKAMSTGGSYGGGKAMSTGGTYSPQSKNLGGPPPPPPGGGGGYFPPPPGSGGPVGGGYSDPLQGFDPTKGTQEARSYVDANLSGDPSYGWFQMLFGRQDFVTGIYGAGTAELDRIRQARSEITAALASADPKQVMLLNAKMQDLNTSEREITDKMMRAQHFQDEFVNMVKGMIDTAMRTTDSIIKNMRQ